MTIDEAREILDGVEDAIQEIKLAAEDGDIEDMDNSELLDLVEELSMALDCVGNAI